MLGLQWADVDLDRKELLIRAENAKGEESRRLPISTRLATVLELAKTNPAGKEYKPEREMLGHASIETADRYLNAGRNGASRLDETS